MKKLIAMVLALTLMLALCACESASPRLADKGKTTATVKVTEPNNEKKTEPVIKPTVVQEVEENIFHNPTNFMEDTGTVTIKPCKVWFEDGQLVAECFVINGLNYAVGNIEVKQLAFANGETDIADASFGMLEGLVLAPHSYTTWTFYFGEEVVSGYGVDLSFLSTSCRTSYSY